MLGLQLVGDAAPIAAAALDAVEQRERLRFPPSYRALLEAWGAGQLCGFCYVRDATDPAPSASWQQTRTFMRGDALDLREQYQLWAAIDDATWRRLVVWGDLDGKQLAWDTGTRDRDGEYATWFLDREGDVAVPAGGSLAEVIAFFRDGGLDRACPPTQGGRWDVPATYVMGRPDGIEARLLAALAANDEDAAEAAFVELRTTRNGYEASAQLLELVLSRAADDLPRTARVAWLERAAKWARRCAPTFTAKHAVPAALAALREGRTLDDLVEVDAAIDARCGVEVAVTLARHDLTYLDCRIRNPRDRASPPCVLRAKAEGGPYVHEFPIEPVPPGGEYPLSFAWPELVPRRVRIELRPAP